jgi:glucose-1-phosphate adenylyltransferase
MKRTRAIILAGGEGSRLGILTQKRTKPALPFAGKYRIIDFPLSNCVNSDIFDVMIVAQYRPHSLIEHIGAGGPWDLNRDFTGGVRIYTPYKGRGGSNWYTGTADAIQQNFRFIKHNKPDLVLILSGDHVYTMNYAAMIDYHRHTGADMTMAAIQVSPDEANRFGIVGLDTDNRVTSFTEKPAHPASNLANMGVYLFNLSALDQVLLEDHRREGSTHDFGKDIIPRMIQDKKVFAYPYDGYWVDVGTLDSYWSAHMDLLNDPPPINLNDRNWVIHTRTEERPPVRFARGATVVDSMITDGCVIAPGAYIERSILAPGVKVAEGATVIESILLTDTVVEQGASVEHVITDKLVTIARDCRVGSIDKVNKDRLTLIGKNSILPPSLIVEAGSVIGSDLIPEDFPSSTVHGNEFLQTKRKYNGI